MYKRGKYRAFPTKEQENERVDLDANLGSIPIARSTSQVVRKAEHPEYRMRYETNEKNAG